MGFLDHSTNNIIIDAVLTNLGREILASNAGQFQISKFSLGDDEVDYSLIRKFGRTIGKEKIIKNTPIFEAQTAQDIAIKSQLISVADPSVTHLPYFVATFTKVGAGTTLDAVAVNGSHTQFYIVQGGSTSGNLTVKQETGAGSIPAGMLDQQFDIYVNNKFINIGATAGGTPLNYNSLDPLTMMARYTRAADGANPGQVTFNVKGKTISTDDFNFYGAQQGGKSVIKTMLSVVGKNSGARVDIVVGVQSGLVN